MLCAQYATRSFVQSACLPSGDLLPHSTPPDVTPEAMSSESSRPYLAHLQKEGMVSLVAVDEAHCISSWGQIRLSQH